MDRRLSDPPPQDVGDHPKAPHLPGARTALIVYAVVAAAAPVARVALARAGLALLPSGAVVTDAVFLAACAMLVLAVFRERDDGPLITAFVVLLASAFALTPVWQASVATLAAAAAIAPVLLSRDRDPVTRPMRVMVVSLVVMFAVGAAVLIAAFAPRGTLFGVPHVANVLFWRDGTIWLAAETQPGSARFNGGVPAQNGTVGADEGEESASPTLVHVYAERILVPGFLLWKRDLYDGSGGVPSLAWKDAHHAYLGRALVDVYTSEPVEYFPPPF